MSERAPRPPGPEPQPLDLAAFDRELGADDPLDETAEAADAPAAPDAQPCPLCGWPNPPSVRDCTGCGRDLVHGSPPPVDRFRPARFDRRWLAVVAAAVVLGGLGLGIRTLVRAGADRRALSRGEGALAAGELTEAIAAFEVATRLAPQSAAAHAALAEALARAGRFEQARAAAQRALSLAPTAPPRALLALGRAHLAAGENEAAVEVLRRAHAARPGLSPVLHLLARALAATGDTSAALGFYEQALREDPDAPEAETSRLALARLWLERGRLDRAEQLLAGLRPRTEAQQLEARMLEGALHERRGERVAAVEAYREAVRLVPGAVAPALHLARALHRLGLPEDALEALSPVLAQPPTPTAALRLQADILAELGRTERAEQLYLEAARRGPGDALALTAAARIAWKAGRRDAATERLERALALDPGNAAASLLAARLALEAGDARRAVATLREAVERDPLAAELRLALGRALLAAGRRDEALVALELAVRTGGDGSAVADAARRLLSQLYAAEGNTAAALEHLGPLVRAHPDDLALAVQRIRLLIAAGERERAQAALEEAARRWPNAPALEPLRAELAAGESAR